MEEEEGQEEEDEESGFTTTVDIHGGRARANQPPRDNATPRDKSTPKRRKLATVGTHASIVPGHYYPGPDRPIICERYKDEQG